MQRRNPMSRARARPRRGRAKKPSQTKLSQSTRPVGQNKFFAIDGFPVKVLTRMRYSERVSFSATAASPTNVWRANGPFDPNQTGTGGQPYNYDDFAIQYTRYRVTACSIKYWWSTNVASTDGVIAVVASNSPTAFSMQDAISSPLVKWKAMKFGSTFNPELTMSLTTERVLGEVLGDRFTSLNTTTPNDPWYYHTYYFNPSADTVTGAMEVELTYTVEWFDRNPLTLDRRLDKALADVAKFTEEKKRREAGDEKQPTPSSRDEPEYETLSLRSLHPAPSGVARTGVKPGPLPAATPKGVR